MKNVMKIGVLSTNKNLYSTQRLVEAGEERGHHMRVINHRRCYMNITTHNPGVHYRGESIEDLDAIIPRIGASISFYGTAVVRQFVGGAPVVVKLLEGTQGVGVVLAETHKAAESVIEAFRGLKAEFMVQEFIKEAGGSDIRCFVVGDKVVASMKRTGKEGEFRSNLHRGGSAEVIKITPEERSTAVRSAKVMGLNVAGVDLLRSNHGPVVMEVNSSPGLEGIEKATGKDVASMIISFIEKNARPGRTQTRGKG